jgi:hypothetical protein
MRSLFVAMARARLLGASTALPGDVSYHRSRSRGPENDDASIVDPIELAPDAA